MNNDLPPYQYVQGDVFEVDLPRRGFSLVYADPPYANCRFKYARKNGSRQWGKHARTDYMRELVARMEYLRATDGIAALSMTSNEALRLGYLFPTNARLYGWFKPYAPFRPGVFPCYAWEPVVAWGRFVNREEQKTTKTPHDWLQLAPQRPKKGEGEHENPKPPAFGDWLINVTLGPRRGSVVELFAGSAPIARAAAALGMQAVGVDFDAYVAAGASANKNEPSTSKHA